MNWLARVLAYFLIEEIIVERGDLDREESRNDTRQDEDFSIEQDDFIYEDNGWMDDEFD